jgi:hypothetical protein
VRFREEDMGTSRRITWVVALAAQVGTFAASGPESRSGEDRTPLRIKVYVYNHAKVSAAVLEHARQEVVRVYRAAGVEAEWVDCARAIEEVDNYPGCRPSLSRHDWFAVQIVSQPMMGGLRLEPSRVGLAALPEQGGFGNWAVVCSQCAEQSVKGVPSLEGRPAAFGTILGDLMAHELGHLLLGTPRHSSLGVMRPHWNRVDLEDAVRGLMCFTAKQAQRIGAQVRDRMRAEDAVGMANLGAPRYPAPLESMK